MLTFVMLIPCILANTKKIVSFNYKSNLTILHFGRGQLTSTRCLRNIWSVEIDTNITYMIIQCSFLRIRLETNFVRLLKVKHQFYGHIRVAFFKSFHLICDMIIKLCEISRIFAMRNLAFSPKFRRKCEISHCESEISHCEILRNFAKFYNHVAYQMKALEKCYKNMTKKLVFDLRGHRGDLK